MLGFVDRFAADAMAGRFTLDRVNLDRAADMIIAAYRELAIAPVSANYRVPFQFPHGSTLERAHHVWFELGGPAHAIAAEQMNTLAVAEDVAVVSELVDVGYGMAPRKAARKAFADAVAGHVVVLREGPADGRDAARPEGLGIKLTRLRDAGARAVLLLDVPASDDATDRARQAAAAASKLPVIELRPGALPRTGPLAALRDPPALPRVIAGARVSLAPREAPTMRDADNVVAWIPGRSKPDEIIVVGAHYDHIGTAHNGQFCRARDNDVVCNGADDNASGTAMVLAIARALATSGRAPERTVVFAHFAAEELGLFGSKALVTDTPTGAPFGGARVVAMINFDMVGRLGKEGLFVGGVGSSGGWMPMLDRIGAHGLPITYEASVSSRSDQASYYKKNIPVLFFFTGLHGDYHAVGDEPEALARDSMVRIGQLALDVVEAAADGADLPFAAADETSPNGLVGRMPGSDPRSVVKRVGGAITAAEADGDGSG